MAQPSTLIQFHINSASRRSRQERQRITMRIILTILMLIIGITTIVPFVWTLSSSFKLERDIFRFPIDWWPANPTITNYDRIFNYDPQTASRQTDFVRAYFNSIVVTIPGVIIPLTTGTLAAYAFARLRFPGRDKLFLLYLTTMIVPAQVLIVPRFLLADSAGIYNTLWALIIPYMTVAYGTFMLRQAFLAIPQDLIDAAKIDGCGHLGVIWNVIVPVSGSSLAALAMLLFIWRWNDYTMPLIMLNRRDLYTLPLALASYVEDPYMARWGQLLAATVLSTGPLLVIFIAANRFFVRSMVHTGVKG